MCSSYYILYGVSVSYLTLYSIVSYVYVSCSGLNTSLGKGELICLLSLTCNYEVSSWSVNLIRVFSMMIHCIS